MVGAERVSLDAHDGIAVLAERAERENLGEEVRQVVPSADVLENDVTRANKLAHEQILVVHVTRAFTDCLVLCDTDRSLIVNVNCDSERWTLADPSSGSLPAFLPHLPNLGAAPFSFYLRSVGSLCGELRGPAPLYEAPLAAFLPGPSSERHGRAVRPPFPA